MAFAILHPENGSTTVHLHDDTQSTWHNISEELNLIKTTKRNSHIANMTTIITNPFSISSVKKNTKRQQVSLKTCYFASAKKNDVGNKIHLWVQTVRLVCILAVLCQHICPEKRYSAFFAVYLSHSKKCRCIRTQGNRINNYQFYKYLQINFVCSIPCIKANFMEKPIKMHL